MNKGISLQAYVSALVRNWRWVLGMLLGGVLTGAVINHLTLSPSYEAVATVNSAAPRYEVSMSRGDWSPVDAKVVTKAAIELATNETLLQEVADSLGDNLPAAMRSGGALSRLCSLSSAADGTIMRLTVRHRDPVLASVIANAWAATFVDKVNATYGQRSSVLDNVRVQVTAAREELTLAEQSVAQFQSTTRLLLLRSAIEEETQALRAYSAIQRDLLLAVQDAYQLSEQLQAAEIEGLGQKSFASRLAGFFVVLAQSEVSRASAGTSAQVQISLDPTSSEKLDRAEQLRLIEDVIAALELRADTVAAAKDDIPAALAKAEQELQLLQNEYESLLLDQELASEKHTTLRRALQELQLATELDTELLLLTLEAEAPESPTSPNKAVGLLAGAAVGLALGVLVALFRQFGWDFLGADEGSF
jgi:capsular polysaccharide biosynthesis protein